MPSPVTSPITVASTSHLRQMAMNAATRSGLTTAIMRSCDSLIRISAGVRLGSRSGMASMSTNMPPSPPADSSVVAQATPAAPRSWMPSTRSAA